MAEVQARFHRAGDGVALQLFADSRIVCSGTLEVGTNRMIWLGVELGASWHGSLEQFSSLLSSQLGYWCEPLTAVLEASRLTDQLEALTYCPVPPGCTKDEFSFRTVAPLVTLAVETA